MGENFPVKPTEPLDSECCGTGCTPCVFDIYKKQLRKWEDECNRIRDNNYEDQNQDQNSSLDIQKQYQLVPEYYLNFKLMGIIPDTCSSNIYRFDAIPCPTKTIPDEGNQGQGQLPVISFSLNGHSGPGRSFRPPPIQMGQHVVIKIENQAKQYTVLDVNKNKDSSNYYFDILIKIYHKGALTPLIGKLNIEDKVAMRGPFGKVVKLGTNTCKNIIMLAAGTGIAPMYRLIENVIRNEDENTKIKLIYCNRSVESILLKEKLAEWSTFWNFQVIHFLSRNGGQNIPYGMRNNVHLRRFIKTDFIKECQNCQSMGSENRNDSRYFVCGTKSFEKDIINYLSKCGVEESSYHIF